MFTPKHSIKVTAFTGSSRVSSSTKIVATVELVFFFYGNTVLVIAFINFSTSIWVSPIPVSKRSVSSSKTFLKSELTTALLTFFCSVEWKLTNRTFMTYLICFFIILSNKTFSKLYFQNAFEYFFIIQYLLDVHLLELIFLFVIMLMVNDDVWSEESENEFTAWLSNYREVLIVILGWFKIVF